MDKKDKIFILMLISAFFKEIFQQNFTVQKSIFLKYVTVTVLFNDKGQFLYYKVALYILVQLEEEYSFIWKTKPLTFQTDKGKL